MASFSSNPYLDDENLMDNIPPSPELDAPVPSDVDGTLMDYAPDDDGPVPQEDNERDYAPDDDGPIPQGEHERDYAPDDDGPVPQGDHERDYAPDEFEKTVCAEYMSYVIPKNQQFEDIALPKFRNWVDFIVPLRQGEFRKHIAFAFHKCLLNWQAFMQRFPLDVVSGSGSSSSTSKPVRSSGPDRQLPLGKQSSSGPMGPSARTVPATMQQDPGQSSSSTRTLRSSVRSFTPAAPASVQRIHSSSRKPTKKTFRKPVFGLIRELDESMLSEEDYLQLSDCLITDDQTNAPIEALADSLGSLYSKVGRSVTATYTNFFRFGRIIHRLKREHEYARTLEDTPASWKEFFLQSGYSGSFCFQRAMKMKVFYENFADYPRIQRCTYKNSSEVLERARDIKGFILNNEDYAHWKTLFD